MCTEVNQRFYYEVIDNIVYKLYYTYCSYCVQVVKKERKTNKKLACNQGMKIYI